MAAAEAVPGPAASPNVAAGWIGMVAGVLSGSLLGLFFQRDEFMGGYDSFPRRLVRLGHISFFGLGILNVLYGLSVPRGAARTGHLAGSSLIVGAVTMPIVCFLTAWRKPMRHLFFVPVGTVLFGIVGACAHSMRRVP